MDVIEFFRKLKFVCHWADHIKDLKWPNVPRVKLSSLSESNDTFLSLQALLDLYYLFGGFMDYLWSCELDISNFGLADRKILPVGAYLVGARATSAAPRIKSIWNSTWQIGGRPGRSSGKTSGNSLTTGMTSYCYWLQVASSGWPFVSAVPGQMTHLVASMTLDSARSCVMQVASYTNEVVVAIVVTVILVVVVGGEGSFHSVPVFLLVLSAFAMVAACASRAASNTTSNYRLIKGINGVVDLTGDEDPTNEDGDNGMGDPTGGSVSLGGVGGVICLIS
ncbi:hypothetical protein Tco_1057261 [Tanacetum coccineum]|uniref:Uncharacterized protein n=1 Tax=Tanacetum coccineum TaxID=301880 RepID=A0ABQ5H669_9ASTR